MLLFYDLFIKGMRKLKTCSGLHKIAPQMIIIEGIFGMPQI